MADELSAPPLILPKQDDPSKLGSLSEVGLPEIIAESPLAVERIADPEPAPKPISAPLVRFVNFNQILVDGKLRGPAAALMEKRPELIPAMVELFQAREDKVQEYHAAVLSSRAAPSTSKES